MGVHDVLVSGLLLQVSLVIVDMVEPDVLFFVVVVVDVFCLCDSLGLLVLDWLFCWELVLVDFDASAS